MAVLAPPPHPPPKCPPPGDARCKLVKSLDSKLYAAANAGWPLWLSDGKGGKLPRRPCHDFGCNALQDGARVDFNRGTAGDDLCNVQWNKLLDCLPKYASVVKQHPSSMISRGNAVEQAIGLAYAAATNAQYLNEGDLDWTRKGLGTSSQSVWAEAWSCFQLLGFGPDINLGPTFGLRPINVPKSPPPPLPADFDHPGGNNGAQAKPPPPLRDPVWPKPSSAASPPAATRPPPTVAVVTAQPPQQPPPPKADPPPPIANPLRLISTASALAATPPVAAVTEARPKQPPPPPADPPPVAQGSSRPPLLLAGRSRHRGSRGIRAGGSNKGGETGSREGCSRCRRRSREGCSRRRRRRRAEKAAAGADDAGDTLCLQVYGIPQPVQLLLVL